MHYVHLARHSLMMDMQQWLASVFEGDVRIKLGGSSLNIDGGLTRLIFPQSMVNSKLADQCCLHTTVSGDSGILFPSIAFLHLSFSAGSRGKRKTAALFPSSKLPLQRVTQHFFPILIVLYKLRCIASKSTEELINLILSHIYIVQTFLNGRLHLNYFSDKRKYYFTR